MKDEGKDLSEVIANICYTALIALQIWITVDRQLDGKLSENVKTWWQKIHRKAVEENEVQRAYAHVLFQAITILEGNNGS